MKRRGKKTKRIILISRIMQFWFEIMKDFKSNLLILNCYVLQFTQCGNLAIFLPLIFYVKSISVSLESQNLLFWQFYHLWNLVLISFCILSDLKLTKNQNSQPLKLAKCQFLRLYILLKLISRKNEWQKNSEISTLCGSSWLLFTLLLIFHICNQLEENLSTKDSSLAKSRQLLKKCIRNTFKV